jgi:hypothetical protein
VILTNSLLSLACVTFEVMKSSKHNHKSKYAGGINNNACKFYPRKGRCQLVDERSDMWLKEVYKVN